MKSWIRHFLPYGLVRSSHIASELQQLGLTAGHAWRLAVRRPTVLRMHQLNLNLLPAGAFAKVENVMDVGANVGDWTADLLYFCRPTQVVCVEPDPTLAAGLRTRFAADPVVAVRQTAVGAAKGTAEFKIMESSVLNSLRMPSASITGVHPGGFAVKEVISVEVNPLDAIAPAGRITLLKIDTQGFEREVLAGARETLARTDYVIMEVNFQPHYEGEADFHELDAIMQTHGFCIGNYSAPKGGRRQALFADVLYLRKDS